LSTHSIAGIVAFNAFLLVVGIAVLFGVRGWGSWNELLRLAGFAYMLGVAAIGVIFVIELVVGLDLSLVTILLTGAGLVFLGALIGRAFGHRLPPAKLVLEGISLKASVFGALAIVYAEALFRSGRLAGLYEFDGWAFWVPKAKAIYFFGGIDRQFFEELPGPSYPPLVPALEAAAFRFMGSPDVVTLHLQFWFLFVGFIAALVGLLAPRVPPLLLWPPILLLAATPHVLVYALQAQGDFLLDEFFALAALLVGMWLVERQPWQLAGATLFLAAAISTKREGYMLTACVMGAALVVAWRQARVLWPRLLLASAVAVVLTIPWRLLLVVHDLTHGGAEAGGFGLFEHADRAWPSFRLALSALFDFNVWLAVVPLALLAIGAAFFAGAKQLAAYASLLVVLLVAAFTWVTWAFPTLPITKQAALNPIVRLSGSLTLALTALAPLLLVAAWRGGRRRGMP
jgi:hypothetical protein